MASNPPFHVEDQTDEDFFDKLVDDDFGPTNSASVPKFTEGSDSDEAKAFANLSIEDTTGEGEVEEKSENDSVHDSAGLPGVHAEESNTLELDSSNSLGSNGTMKSNSDGIRTEVVSDSLVSQNSGPMKAAVKEVDWGSFYADSVPNGNNGFGSYSDFFSVLGVSSENVPEKVVGSANLENKDGDGLHNSISYAEHQDVTQSYGESLEECVNGQDVNSSQYWESMYPGWRYDANTGQWYQVDGYDATTSVQENFNANATSAQDGFSSNGISVKESFNTNAANECAAVSDRKTELNYLQQTSKSVVGAVAETSTSETVSTWNQVSQEVNNGYPEHMVFDPQYPGWYYDTIAQEWRSWESCMSSIQSTNVQIHDQQKQNEIALDDSYSQNSNSNYGGYEQAEKNRLQGYDSQGQHGSWGESYGGYNQQGLSIWQTEAVAKAGTVSNFDGDQQLHNSYDSNMFIENRAENQKPLNSFGMVPSYGKMSQGHVEANGFVGSQSFIPSGNFSQQLNQGNLMLNEQISISNDYYGSQKPVNAAQKSFQSNQQFSFDSNSGRSSAGRPPHALVTFGFGGKLIVMRDSSSNSLANSSFGSQEPLGGSISVLNLMEVVFENTNNAPNIGGSICNYFGALCQQSFPGPLVGGSVGSKELNKWIDERIANCESPDVDNKKGEILKLLHSLLKIACQHYGKLRSPFGADSSLKESDSPESAVANLFASVKRNCTQFSDYGAVSHCLQNLPSEGQLLATASEVQNLLVSGRKKEALQCAQEGQLWGPALVLSSQLGDQFYVDTVKQMALHQLVAGSPLRTLCLLIAGQPADVFSGDTAAGIGLPGVVSQQSIQFGANGMLDDWEENLAVITANRTKDDELVIIHLGDCLWKDRSEITAAHICYLVAESNFESYSDSARLCLIGADHWKHPRTYSSPEAIQRTEFYEYSKVLGNSQFILLPFQPYKLIYAYMMAEVGKVSDSLKYCQAILKSLRNGRAPEIETWKQLVLSLEERIRTHQQGGYTANLAPAKLVGKLLNFFDSTAHRVVGGLPPPVPSPPQGSIQGNRNHQQPMASRVSASQSTMAMSSLTSASMEPISEWAADGSRMTVHNRSVSEPDFGRTPRQVDSSKEVTSTSAQGKPSGSGTTSRFSRFGFGSQLLQKTVGLVLRPRSERQAKLGEKNKFYYDEKLKRWVEEGAEPPAEEAALPPPPTALAFQNGVSDYNLKSALSDGSPSNGSSTFKTPTPTEYSSGIPPIPTSSNQFSARGRMGVRARYVDTFNQGGGSSAKLFQSPSVPSVKPPVSANAKFFVPTPPPSSENAKETISENVQESTRFADNPSTSIDETFQSPSPPTFSKMNMQRFPSMDNITRQDSKSNGNASISTDSRRTASWSGFSDSFSPLRTVETKPQGQAAGMPSTFLPGNPAMPHMRRSSGSIGEDLHEVEL